MTSWSEACDARPHLLGPQLAEQYRGLVEDAGVRIARRFREIEHPATDTPAQTLHERVQAIDLEEPLGDGHSALAEVDDLFLSEAVWFHTPGYLAHLNCPVDINAVAAESVLAAVNTSVDTYDQSRMGTLIERRVIEWVAGKVGFGHGDGVFTSGGTQSNVQALYLARELALAGTTGWVRNRQQERLVLLATAESHFSIARAARLLGLSDDAVVTVSTDDDGRMSPESLQSRLREVDLQGRSPLAVVATAGSTDRGVVDDLREISSICRQAGVRLHVDAAYGCGLLVSQQHLHLVDGIEDADSVTLDFHKTFFQPVSSSALIVRDSRDFAAGAWHADYLNPADADEPNQVDKSLQTTRRFDALKLFLTLRSTGPARIGRSMDAVVGLTREVHRWVTRHAELRLLSATDLSTVLFRWQPEGVSDDDADALVAEVRSALQRQGRILVAKTVIEGRPSLKLTLLNPDLDAVQVCAQLEEVAATAAGLHRVRMSHTAPVEEVLV